LKVRDVHIPIPNTAPDTRSMHARRDVRGEMNEEEMLMAG